MTLLAEQKAIPMDQLGRFLGLSPGGAERLVGRLAERRLVAMDRLLEGEAPWAWLRAAGARLSVTGFAARKPRLVSLAHLRAINEARLAVEGRGVAGLEWVCERRVWKEQGAVLKMFVPDAVVKVDGSRHAVEVELSRKSPEELREKIETLEGRFDLVVYFATPEIRRYFERLDLAAEHPKVVVREVEVRSRCLNRADWRVPGDPPPVACGEDRPAELCEGDLEALDVIAEQGAIPMDQLREFFGETEEESERRVQRYLAEQLVRRARPVPGESAWVWLSGRGMRESSHDLSISPPRLGGLEALRDVNEVRLLVEASGEGRWISGRLLRRQRGARGSLPVGVVEVGEERHSIDIWRSVGDPAMLRRRLACREAEYDVVAWFYSRKACAVVDGFAGRAGSPKLVVRPIPKVDLKGLRPSTRGPRGRRRRAVGPVDSETLLWRRLRATGPVRLVPVVVESVAEEALEAIASASGGRRPRVEAAWRRPGKGMRLFRLETDLGVYRVIRSSWGWRVSEVRDESVFVLAPGEPVVLDDPRPVGGHRPRAVEFEFGEEVWEKVAPLIPPLEERPARQKRGVVSDRAALSGMVWRLRHGSGGGRPPEELGYGAPTTLDKRRREWCELGIWEEIQAILERELPDGAELEFARLKGSWQRASSGELNERQRGVVRRLQEQSGSCVWVEEYATMGGISQGLASTELRQLAARGLLVGRRGAGRLPLFWAPRDMRARLAQQGMEGLVLGSDADWCPPRRRWSGDRLLELMRTIVDQRAVEVGLLARICRLEPAELGEVLVELRGERLLGAVEVEGAEWPWVWPRRRGARLVGGVRWGCPKGDEFEYLGAASAARVALMERHPDAEWVSGEDLQMDVWSGGGEGEPAAMLEVMGRDGLLGRRAVLVDVPRPGRSRESLSELVAAVSAAEERYDGVEVVCGGPVEPSLRALAGGAVAIWPEPSAGSSPSREDSGWLGRLKQRPHGDRRGGWRYPLRVYAGRSRVHVGGRVVVYGVTPAALPPEGREAIAEVVDGEEAARPLEVWRKDGGGNRVFCVRTRDAEFRVVGCGSRWRADEVLGEGVFEKRPRRTAPKRRALRVKKPRVVYEIAAEELPQEGVEAIRLAVEATEPPRVEAVWRNYGGMRVYCVECSEGMFRAVRSGYGWRADPAKPEMFVKRSAEERRFSEVRGMAVYEVEPEVYPSGLGETLAAAVGGAEVRVDGVWRRARKPFVYCVETERGTFRVQRREDRSWRAEPAGPGTFVKKAGPMPGVDPARRVVEPARFEIDDAAWARVAPAIPEAGGGRLHRGNIRYSDRALVSGLLYYLRNEPSAWSKLPSELGFGTQWACRRRLARWQELGAWEGIRLALERELPDGRELRWERLYGGSSLAASRSVARPSLMQRSTLV